MDSLIVGECRTYSDRPHTHAHEFAQLILPLQGRLSIATAQNQLELDPSRLFFLPPHCPHSFHSKATNRFLVLDVSQHFLEPSFALTDELSLPMDDRWDTVRSLLLFEVQQSSSSDLASLFRYIQGLLQRQVTPRSIQFLHTNLHQTLNLNQLAQLEGYTPTYYCDWFKKQTGTTPNAYLQSLRLQRAKELLADTDLSILQIAQQVGYEHHSSLTRLFQKLERTTPIAYRHQNRNLVKE
jgi:AraC-like DNA-binding protein